MSDEALTKNLSGRMQGAVDVLSREFRGLRAGRASPSMVEHLNVQAYGASMPVSQIASVSVPESRMLSINVWDSGLVAAVEKAVQESELGLTPQTEGQVIRLRVPELSEERRRDLIRVAARYAEQARVAVRNVRRDGMDQLSQQMRGGEISEDDKHAAGEDIQKLTSEFVKKIDAILQQKQADIEAI